MMLVMMAVATIGVMTYALCAATQLRSQIADAASIRVQGEHLAESGLNLAVYYLQNPKSSPVALTYGESGNVHYPGESPLVVPGLPGELAVTVTNPANGTFTVTSVATFEGNTTTATATLAVTKSKTFDYAAVLTGSPTLNNKVKITGGAITSGAIVQNSATLLGTIIASNGSSFGGSAATSVTPTIYPVSAPYYLPYYFRGGKKYTAKLLQSNVLTSLQLLNTDPTNNPANVLYVDRDITVFISPTLTGTLAIKAGAKVSLAGNLTINPIYNDMPALIAAGNIAFISNAKTLQCNGVAYVGGRVTGSGTTSGCKFRVSGTLFAPVGGWPFESSYGGEVEATYNSARAKVSALADEIEGIDTLRVRSWELTNGRPQ
ncbi:MAG TPA: hypothetical protein VF624_04590, partial [Tepidisphaeraceae bacterium]|jgi:hypothetical protein